MLLGLVVMNNNFGDLWVIATFGEAYMEIVCHGTSCEAMCHLE